MRRGSMIAAVLALGCLASPSAAEDLTYRHSQDGPHMLERSNGRAYWVLLAECSGFYGALSNTATDDAARETYLEEALVLFRLGLERARADRSLTRDQAVELLDPYVQRARTLGESSLASEAQTERSDALTPRILMTSTCGSLRREYTASTGA